ncbi:WD40 repeat domain-containing protein [Cyanobium sp. CH-040]|uniref:WD40 repeat domain-containing protein n=1 Tax=Cyanobium sp. CH-040 TaxID=2823708 RepID=UPI0020CE4A85|nr:WD40 repeat domain-containing protein [Cyanobium sp. CH-040]MCP9927449.1 WD40 repeat domain-containing protein [Cyanobium sp. CH-040]
MTLFPDADTLLQLVLPKLLRMTAFSAVVGGVVGGMVAAVARRPLRPALWGSFVAVFLFGLLPIEANPASLIGGPYAGLWLGFMVLMLVPAAAIAGAVLGLISAALPRSPLHQPRQRAGITLAGYLISALVLTVSLSPPGISVRVPESSGSFPLVAEVSGIESPPLDLALSADGHRLAVLSVRYGRQQVDIVDLTTRKQHRIRNLHGKPDGRQTLADILSTLAFTADGQELVTAAVEQVQVRTLPEGRPRLRLAGGEVAYPMADDRLVTLASLDASAGSPAPRSLQVWDLSSGRRLQSLAADLNTLDRNTVPVAMSTDRRLLAFPHRIRNDRIEVWNIGEGRLISNLELEGRQGIRALAFSPDGRQLALALDQTPPLTIWDLAAASPIRMLNTADPVHQLYWTTGGLLAGYDGAIRVLSVQNGAVLHTLQLRSPGPSSPARPRLPMQPSSLSGDGNTLAAHFPGHGIGIWRVGQAE